MQALCVHGAWDGPRNKGVFGEWWGWRGWGVGEETAPWLMIRRPRMSEADTSPLQRAAPAPTTRGTSRLLLLFYCAAPVRHTAHPTASALLVVSSFPGLLRPSQTPTRSRLGML
jgi:hypothetical protein